jgi:hypothetical protein
VIQFDRSITQPGFGEGRGRRRCIARQNGDTIAWWRYGAEIDPRNPGECTALHFAAEGGHEASAVRLLEEGADVSSRDYPGRSALHIKVWLRRGADVSALDECRETALHWGAE